MNRVVVQFSCGAASAVALKLAVEKYGAPSVFVINAFVADENVDDECGSNRVLIPRAANAAGNEHLERPAEPTRFVARAFDSPGRPVVG